MVSSRLDPRPYIFLEMQLRTIFTMGDAKTATPAIIRRNSSRTARNVVVKLRKSRESSPRMVMEVQHSLQRGCDLSKPYHQDRGGRKQLKIQQEVI